MAKYLLKKDSSGGFYWILKSDKNGKTIAKSSESYESKDGAAASINWVKVNAKGANVEDECVKFI
ncbi:MAG: hypothetical protein UT64_C0035G0002 [Candidatus Falkowbacteria bacterium GW2011_GWF2_39_8]|uniref:DUF1508 domain-containing protein n=1 Tax=Candidatus Falkowbacteria bacterium GW2011_GWF2_39_8 TaxID=1618642 RepID=A0A0G0PWU0_9BACT|nr:MAG: hypothetical protein UT64_C0035G0002 [Candidatus Falkowbacteria bacterium GW2011_GWF2_39_8]